MMIVFCIVVLLTCVILGFIILVQNPKGGGLAANIGGISNQFMGVKQTNDVLEKGTWIFATIVALLCVFSVVFIPHTTGNRDMLDRINTKPSSTNYPSAMPPAPQQQQPVAPAPASK